MPEIIETTVYGLEELSEAAEERAFEQDVLRRVRSD